MSFTDKFGVAGALVALTLALQCVWTAILIIWGRAHFERERRVLGAVRCAWLMLWIMVDIVILHVVEISMWGAFYRWKCFANWGSAFYFSAGSFTTVGAGTLSLPLQWRTLQPLEGLTGVLMCGLSASFLFAVVTRLVEREETLLKVEDHTASQPRIAALAEES
jgi:hypothetical protein